MVDFDVDSKTPFIIDIVPIGNYLHVYVSSRVLKNNFHERLIFKEDGAELSVEILRPVPRGLDITLVRKSANKAQKLTIELDINPSLAEHFTGLNTIFLSEVEPDTGALKDWLAYHCTQHGLEAVVLLRRGEKKWPGRAAVNRMMKPAEAINGLKVFALLESSMPLGHPKYPNLKDRHTTPDGPGKALLDPAVRVPYSSALNEISIMDGVEL